MHGDATPTGRVASTEYVAVGRSTDEITAERILRHYGNLMLRRGPPRRQPDILIEFRNLELFKSYLIQREGCRSKIHIASRIMTIPSGHFVNLVPRRIALTTMVTCRKRICREKGGSLQLFSLFSCTLLAAVPETLTCSPHCSSSTLLKLLGVRSASHGLSRKSLLSASAILLHRLAEII